jgi:surface antigen
MRLQELKCRARGAIVRYVLGDDHVDVSFKKNLSNLFYLNVILPLLQKTKGKSTMKIHFKICSVILACLLVSGCAGNKQAGGTGVGAVAGGILGSMFGKGEGRILAIAAGALAGGFVGNQVGKSMDDTDKMMAASSSVKALEYSPSGQAVAWRNPDNGHSGAIIPNKTYRADSGQYCREYTQTVNIGGKQEKAYGKACRKPDGQWEVVK